MLDNRRHLRIREITDIRWALLGSDISGEGKVLNVSESGLLLVTDDKFNPQRQGMIFIDAHNTEPLSFGSKKGKIVWMRKLQSGQKGYQCGVEFIKNAPWDKTLHDWINRKTDEMAQTLNANILTNYMM